MNVVMGEAFLPDVWSGEVTCYVDSNMLCSETIEVLRCEGKPRTGRGPSVSNPISPHGQIPETR